jgi:hypothetical protein
VLVVVVTVVPGGGATGTFCRVVVVCSVLDERTVCGVEQAPAKAAAPSSMAAGNSRRPACIVGIVVEWDMIFDPVARCHECAARIRSA